MLIYIFSFVVLLSNNRVFLLPGRVYVPADMSVKLQIVPASFAKGVLVSEYDCQACQVLGAHLILRNMSPASLAVSDIISTLLMSDGAFMES